MRKACHRKRNSRETPLTMILPCYCCPRLSAALLVLVLLMTCISNSCRHGGVLASYVRQRRQPGKDTQGVNIVSNTGFDLSGAFSLEQELGVKYSIGFLPYDGAASSSDHQSSENEEVMRLMMHNGTLYDCRVVSSKNQTNEGQQEDIDVTATMREARNVLDSIPEWCAYRVEGWWTYEVCYGKKVRQYHLDSKNGNEVSSDFLLGRYSESLGDLILKDVNSNSSDWSGADSSDVYVADICEEGDVCDLEDVGGPVGMKRRVEVRYYCGASLRPMLVDVKEPRSCHYIFDVRIASLCSVSGLSTRSNIPLRQIECKQSL